MTQSVIEKKKYTCEDYLKVPEGERYELIEGDLLITPLSIPNYQRISRKLDLKL